MDIVAAAKQIAKQAHIIQVRKWSSEPYLCHVERVVLGTLRLIQASEEYSYTKYLKLVKEAEAVAWLHDSVEDTDWFTEDLLRTLFPSIVADAVMLLTRVRKGSYTLPYGAFIDRIAISAKRKELAGEIAHFVKIADLQDNLIGCQSPTLQARYEGALSILLNGKLYDNEN